MHGARNYLAIDGVSIVGDSMDDGTLRTFCFVQTIEGFDEGRDDELVDIQVCIACDRDCFCGEQRCEDGLDPR